MLFTKKNSIEEIIYTKLQYGPISTTKLIEYVKSTRPKTTKQGVYLVLRDLRRKELIVIHNKNISFNILWLQKMKSFFTVTEQHYVEDTFGRDNFLNLKEGERISYFFNNPVETDRFWGHALVTLAESSIPNNEPVFLYNPHEWFLIVRQESERECITNITKKRRFLLTCGGKTALDHVVTKEFNGNMSQYHMLEKQLFPKNNYYFNVVGDFIIEAWIDKTIGNNIDEIYNKSKELNESIKEKLTYAVEGKGRTKFVISRNTKKAEKLKKLIRKNFYIPLGK